MVPPLVRTAEYVMPMVALAAGTAPNAPIFVGFAI
jgi:hypothetical protein